MTEIGKYAFYSLDNLIQVQLPESLTTIYAYAFENCGVLTAVDIPENVKSIGTYGFAYCPGLTQVSIPEGMTNIGEYAFRGCTALTEMTIPEGIRKIESSAFYECVSLTLTYKGAVRDWVTKCVSVYRTICSDMLVESWGTCGSNLRWTLDDKGTLTVYGTGALRFLQQQ